jgi:hypothetical protein
VLSAIIAPNPKCYDVNYVGTSVIAQLSNIMLLCVCIYIYIYIEREREIYNNNTNTNDLGNTDIKEWMR